jgi:1,4-dihydroxy-2-naphthoyl-CoA hydrolase
MTFIYKPTPQKLNEFIGNTIAGFIGIEFIETGDNFLIARMPVNERTQQSLGMLNGGASCVLAETIGSLGANLFLNRDTHVALGLDINANHVKAAKEGYVYGKALPIHIGSRTHIWEIKITDEANELVCISRLTMIIVPVTAETKRKIDLKIQ